MPEPWQGRVYDGNRWRRRRRRAALVLAWLVLGLLVTAGCGLAFGVYLAEWLGV